MIHIDLNLESQTIIVTASERWSGEGDAFRMKLYSPFTKTTYSLLLGENLSTWISRYDEFNISTNDFPVKVPGTLDYTIYEYDSSTQSDIKVLESGSLKVSK